MTIVSGLLLTSLTNAIWQAYLTYGVVYGLGGSIIWTTTLAQLPYYFQRRLVLACAIGMTGRFLGIACLSPVARILMKFYGWRRMLQIFAALGFPMLICDALYRRSSNYRPVKVSLTRRLVNCCRLHGNLRLSFYVWIVAMNSTSMKIPVTYIVRHG